MYAEFETEADFPFPPLIKAYLTLQNGCHQSAFMSAGNIYKEWKQWFDIYNDWTQEELRDTYSKNQEKVLQMYTTPYWIPFFDLENGNFLAFDFAPNTKGLPGQIISFGADQDIGVQQAESLSAFLKGLLNS